ncbi:hypothetical protein BH11ACT3_BH11ACT3_18340 [soil metagenome]
MVLALLPNSRIYRLGFLRRAARFCIPSGLVVAAAVLTVVACSTLVMKASPAQVQTTAVITLTLCGLGVLGILARPYTRGTALVVGGGYAGLIGVLSIPVARDFLQLSVPSLELLILAIATSSVARLLLELVSRSKLRRRSR